jgi:hypothetical protein
MNQLFLRGAFPSVTYEFENDWAERAKTGRTYVYDRVLFGDRAAAAHGSNYERTQRTASEPFTLPGSVHWWNTIRNNVIESTGVKSVVGQGTRQKPVITYISRQQWGRRMLKPADHEKLVEELYKLRDNYGYEVNIVSMDKVPRLDQIRLAARTTVSIMFGDRLHRLI